MDKWFESVQSVTERYLTRRKRKKAYIKAKQKAKNPIIDWIEAFLWAAIVVLLINQYVAQAYQIPSGSMKNTLKIQDRIFVNKMIYGPELIPGALKLPGFVSPTRDEVVIFESPTYISKGPLFDTLQRLLYMLTFSMVDIDRDEEGNPKPHFLIKRAVGMPRDRIRFEKGYVEIMPPGFKTWMSEGEREASMMPNITDMFEWMKYRNEMLYKIHPQDRRIASLWRKFHTGWYIDEGLIFPLGDNRANSKDARYFGPVS